MTVKCTGAEFLRFYNDKAWWFSKQDGTAEDGEETWWEDAEVVVSGIRVAEYEYDFNTNIKPTDTVTVRGGVVFGKVVGTKEPTVEAYLKRWLKAQRTTVLVVDCPNEKLDAIRAAIKAAGGSVQQ